MSNKYEMTTKAVRSGSRKINKTYYRHILPGGTRSGWILVDKKTARKMLADGLAVNI